MDAEVAENVSVAGSRWVLVRPDWSEAEQTSAYPVNQVLARVEPLSSRGVPDRIDVARGIVSPPVIPADDDRREARLEELAWNVPKVAVHARIRLSREALQEPIQVLQTTADQYDGSVRLAVGSEKHE